ncbi:MAG: DUF2784 domain-containing protein [Mycobacterium sp.]|nr:DUF2784 domain-containing protein [Mycobacterium sp.]
MYQGAVALVALTVVVHVAFLCYLVVGGFLALRWRRTIWLHIVAALWGIAITTQHLDCPLTWLERWSRARAGMAPLPPAGFIAHYLTGVLYPAGWAAALQVVVFGLVTASWVLYAWRGWQPTDAKPSHPAGDQLH